MNGIRSIFNAVQKFWFAPRDPTTLGFIRVVTGLMIVYTHFAYCYDLNAFFGKTAWWDLDSINRERKEQPHVAPPLYGWDKLETPLLGWDDRVATARVPEAPHRKKAVVNWMKSITSDPAKHERAMTLLRDLQSTKDGTIVRQVLLYVQQLRMDKLVRKAHLDAMVKESLRNALDNAPIPQYLKNLPETGTPSRANYRKAIDQFLEELPGDLDDRQYVLNHLIEMDDIARTATIDFLDNPNTNVDAIDYLAYWNFDRAKTIRTGQPIFSLWFHVFEPGEMALAHGIMLFIMILFTLGLWTRVTSVLTWIIAVSYIHRSQLILFGMDTMSNILLLYIMIGNSGGAFSLDRLIARFRATRASLKRCGSIDGPTAAFLAQPPATMSTGLALRLIQVHFCFIYMAAGLSKLKGSTWWNHYAYWETMANPEFTMIQFDWYLELLRKLTQNRPLYSLTASIAIFHTFLCEIGLPFLVWTRARPWIIIIGLFLHAGIAIFMGLTVFSLLMMIMLLAYLPGVAIRGRLIGKAEKKLTVIFNPTDDRQAGAAARAMAFDTDAGIELKADAKATGISVAQSGERLEGVDAAKRIAAQSSLINWMMWIPGVSTLLAKCFVPASR